MGTQLFDEVVGELPPSAVDVNDIIRSEKRRSSVRATGIASAVVALSITAGLVLTMGGGPGASSPPAATQTATGTPSGSGTHGGSGARFALVADTAETAAATAKRLGIALDGAISKEAPGTKWLTGSVPKIAYKTTQPAGVDMFSGDGAMAYHGRKGTVALSILLLRPSAEGPDAGKAIDPLACQPGAKCVEGRSPAGARTMIVTNGGVVEAKVDLSGKRWLTISVANEAGADGDGPAQAATPLTAAQALAVATNLAGQIKS